MEWIVRGTLSIDSGSCAFADPAGIPVSFEMPISNETVVNLSSKGIGLVACVTREDLDMPVEVAADGSGARLEFVNDVAALEGRWKQAGHLHIRSGICMACDPYRLTDSFYRIEFPLRAARYVVEVFECSAGENVVDILGLRIRVA